MPELGLEALSVLLILLPGFLCARIVQALCVRVSQTELDKVIEALLYSFVIYVVFALFVDGFPVALRVESVGEVKRYAIESKPLAFLTLGGVALAWALLISVSTTNDLHGKLLRRLRITQRTARSSVWSDVFHQLGGYVQVELADGRNVLGWLRYYSDTPEECTLYLEDAAWIGLDQKTVRVPGPGVLLTAKSGIRTIMFLDPEHVSPGKH
jgi:hypothetical protein